MGRILSWLRGGRPMRRVGFAFTDKVSGRPVFYFTDTFGRHWLAEHARSAFRVQLRVIPTGETP